jgi:serine/threonine-protein kinase RsbW
MRKLLLGMTTDAIPERAAFVRGNIRGALEAEAIPDFQISDIIVAVGEAVLNVIEHAYREPGGLLDLSVALEDDEIQVCVVDHGCWKNHEHRAERGHGLELMRQLAGRLSVDDNGELPGTTIYMSFPRDAARSALRKVS